MAFAGVLADADVNAALAACEGKTQFLVVYTTCKLWSGYILQTIESFESEIISEMRKQRVCGAK